MTSLASVPIIGLAGQSTRSSGGVAAKTDSGLGAGFMLCLTGCSPCLTSTPQSSAGGENDLDWRESRFIGWTFALLVMLPRGQHPPS